MSARLSVSIVTHNSCLHLEPCLESLKRQSFRDFDVLLWDNASTDATAETAAHYRDLLSFVHISESNVGFCAAHNNLIRSSTSDYVLVLNPDIILDPIFVETLIRAMDEDSTAGSATGKLWRRSGHRAGNRILDTTGIYFTRNQRHLDRGAGEIDSGQYDRREYVFGASGAAALYRRIMLDDISEGGEYFDESFFAYREDADLAWRAQWMGWRCLYVPEAKGYHERRVLPERRASLPDAINMHSFKNRFLLRIKNMDLGTYARYFGPITLRDITAIAYVLLCEWPSLRGIPLLIRAMPKAWAARKSLKKRRRISPSEIRLWFSGSKAKSPHRNA